MKIQKNQSGFSVVEVLLVLIFLAIIGFAGYFVYSSQHKDVSKTDTSQSPFRTSVSKVAEQPNVKFVSYGDIGLANDMPPKGGVVLNSANDITKLNGASNNLKAYLAKYGLPQSCGAPGIGCGDDGMTTPYTVISVYGDWAVVVMPDSLGLLGPGGTFEPDQTSNGIGVVEGIQQLTSCSDLKQVILKYQVPIELYTADSYFTCYASPNSSPIPYKEFKG